MNIKTTFILAVFAFIGMTLQAQTEKGRLYVGATTSDLSFSRSNGSPSFNLNISPSVGYFVADNLAIGARANFNFNAISNTLGDHYRNYGGSFLAFGRYYIPLTDHIKIPIDLEAGIGSSLSKSPTATYKASAFLMGAHSGVSIFLNSHVSIDLLIGYSGNQRLGDNPGTTYSGRIDGRFGFSIYLDGKKKGE